MNATIEYLRNCASAPAGVETLQDSDLPADVDNELAALGIGVGSFFQLLPLLIQLIQNPQVRDLVEAILKTLKNNP